MSRMMRAVAPVLFAAWRGIDAFTLMQHDGRWRIVALAYTDAP
jgi:hypothetical protein